MFGKRRTPFGSKPPGPGAPPRPPAPGAPEPGSSGFPRPPRDSDGKRRIFGEAVYAQHGEFLRMLGKDINDADNILPEPEDFDRMVQDSLKRQEERRCAIEADLLEKHGFNAIRPFFVLAEPVLNSQLGAWLIQVMNLLPYEDWNLVYLPTDQATARAMDLPLHPGMSIGPIDELMVERIGGFRDRFEDGRRKVDAAMQGGAPDQFEVMDKFLAFKDKMRTSIVDYVLSVKPKIVELIADVQSKGSNS